MARPSRRTQRRSSHVAGGRCPSCTLFRHVPTRPAPSPLPSSPPPEKDQVHRIGKIVTDAAKVKHKHIHFCHFISRGKTPTGTLKSGHNSADQTSGTDRDASCSEHPAETESPKEAHSGCWAHGSQRDTCPSLTPYAHLLGCPRLLVPMLCSPKSRASKCPHFPQSPLSS